MSWRDQLQRASFRGTPFHTRVDGVEIGRRQVVHEYPLRDTPYIEDMGRKLRRFTIEAYVIGPKYMAARDKLMAAIEQTGPGALVHPYFGQMRASVTACRLKQSSREGGMARFSITFVESGENKFPDTKPDTPAIVDEKADLCAGVFEEDFAAVFSIEGMPEFILGEANALVQGALDAVAAISDAVPTIPSEITGFVADIEKLGADLTYLIYQPAILANRVRSLIGRVLSVADGPANALSMLRALFGHGDDVRAVSVTTPSRRQQAANQAAIINLVQRPALVEAARVASQISYESRGQAIAIRDEIADGIDLHLDAAGDAAYSAMQAVRIALVKDIAVRAADLSRILSYTPKTTEPALVIAHRLYQDATRESDIVARNRIRHPGFVTGGQTLEVLTTDGLTLRSTGRAGGGLANA